MIGRPWLDRPTAVKVPHVALVFWLVKLLTTGMGEAMSDFVAGVEPTALAGGILVVGLAAFAVVFVRQLAADGYHPVRYWCTVAFVAIYGTMAADVAHVVLGNVVTTIGYAVATAVVLGWWRRSEGTIAIHSITDRRRELFYWATVAGTFALGTAAGDLAAENLGLGYRDAIVAFSALMAVVVVLWRLRALPVVAAFWTAYALTRPLGASIADWLAKPSSGPHGLGIGDGPVSAVCLVGFVALVAWLAVTRRDRPRGGDEL